jgi:hypothetical protein
MTINTSLSASNFQATKAHGHKHTQAAGSKPQAGNTADTSLISDSDAVSAENQVAATSINDPVDATKVIAGLRAALLQSPDQALQAQGNISPETVMALLA